jgi:hypothetical protein
VIAGTATKNQVQALHNSLKRYQEQIIGNPDLHTEGSTEKPDNNQDEIGNSSPDQTA